MSKINKILELKSATPLLIIAIIFSGFLLKKIDLTNLENAAFFVLFPPRLVDYSLMPAQTQWSGFLVRLGNKNIKEKMLILGGVIIQARKEWGNINYIDLRFKEPVIKLNNVK